MYKKSIYHLVPLSGDFHLNELLFSLKMTNSFLPPILIRRLLLQAYIQIIFFFNYCSALIQLMKFKQSFITVRPRTISQPNRPVMYTGQVPSYKEENQNTRNLNNVFLIRGPHSSNSDPSKFLKKKSNNFQITTSVSSEEKKLKEEIQELKATEKKIEAQMDGQIRRLNNYRKFSEEAVQRKDDKMMKHYQLKQSQSVRLIQNYCNRLNKLNEEKRELKKQLQKLQSKKI